MIIVKSWWKDTAYRVELRGERCTVRRTILVDPAKNLRSNTGDDMLRVAFSSDASSGMNPLARQVTDDKVHEALEAAQETAAAKKQVEADKAQAKAEEKLEKERQKEIAKEKARLEREEKQKEALRLKEEARLEKEQQIREQEQFAPRGAGRWRAAKTHLGTKRYTATQASRTPASKNRKAELKRVLALALGIGLSHLCSCRLSVGLIVCDWLVARLLLIVV